MRMKSLSTSRRIMALAAITTIVAISQTLPALALNEPQITAAVPAPNSVHKSASVPSITVTFDRDIRSPQAGEDPSSLVVKNGVGTSIPGAVIRRADNRSLTFTPASSFTGAQSPLRVNATAHPDVVGDPTAVPEYLIHLDDTPPVIPTISSPAAGSFTTAQVVHLIGTSEANSSLTVKETGRPDLGATASNSGAYDIALNYPDGENGVTHTISITATDSVGNTSAPNNWSFKRDVVAPDAPTLTTPATDLQTSLRDVSLGGASPQNGTIKIFDGAVAIGTTTATSNSWSHTLTGLADGEHALTARAQDPAGNLSSPSNSRLVTIDATAPAVPTIQAPTINDANKNALPVKGAAEPSSKIEITINDTDPITDPITTSVTAVAADEDGNNYATTLDVGTLKDNNPITILVKSTDQAGNASSSSIVIAKDTANPLVPTAAFLNAKWINSDNVSAVVVKGAGEKNSTVLLTVAGGAESVEEQGVVGADGNYSISFDATGLPEGTVGATVRLRDAAGNTSDAVAATSVTKDTVAPSAPAFTTPTPNQIVKNKAVEVAGTSEPNANISILENDTIVANAATATDASTWTDTVNETVDGTHTLKARQQDAAGNWGTALASVTFSLNAVAPSLVSITPAHLAELQSVTKVVGTYSEGLSSAAVTVKDKALTIVLGTTSTSGPTVTWTPGSALTEAASPYTVEMQATDTSGGTEATSELSTTTFKVDVTAPTIPVISTPAEGAHIANYAVTLGGTADTGSTVELKEGSTVLGSFVPTGDTGDAAKKSWTFSKTFGAIGSHTVTATARDNAGNVSGVSSRTFVIEIDTAAPPAPVITAPLQNAQINSLSVTITGTAEATSTVKLYNGATQLPGTTTADAAGAWTKLISVTPGLYAITATATDANNNVSPASAVRNFRVIDDTGAPDVPVITSPATGSILGATFIVKGTAEAGTTVRVYRGDTLLSGTVTTGSNGQWSKAVTLASGSHTLKSTATDEASNTSAFSAPITVEVDATVPAVSFSTTSGTMYMLDDTFEITGNASDNRKLAAVEVAFYDLRGNKVKTVTATLATPEATSSTWTATADLTPGQYTIIATAVDGVSLRTKTGQITVYQLTGALPTLPSVPSPAPSP